MKHQSFFKGLPRIVWILIGLAVVFGIGTMLLLVWIMGDIFSSSSGVTASASEITAFTSITIPASAQNLQSHVEAFQDTLMYVRFDLPPSDVAGWIAAQSWDNPPINKPIEYPFTSDFEWMRDKAWWQPKQATNPQIGTISYNHPQRGIINPSVLLDSSDPAKTIVYVVAFDT